MSDPSGVAGFQAARERVHDRIAEACVRAGRSPADVMLVAVSKTVAPERLRDAVAAGLDLLGENRVQEALGKIPDVPGARWHLVGPLQSNKARRALEAFDLIQTLDSVDLGRRLDRLAGESGRDRIRVLLQVNVDEDAGKFGFQPVDLPEALDALAGCPRLDVAGLMTIGRQVERPDDARATFAGLRELAGRLRTRAPQLGPALSMGMSNDYAVAIEEGATIVRVGRALFGDRPHQHHDGDHRH